MLADPRSEALAHNFAGQWLYLRNLKDAQPDLFTYPNFDENLLQSMRRETELFFDSIMREDRNVTDLLTANYTFVDERLAKHYGIPNVEGNRFRRVTLTDPNRFGLLGQGSILTVTSFANRTSPVVRGKWVMENLLGAPPPIRPLMCRRFKESTADGARMLSGARAPGRSTARIRCAPPATNDGSDRLRAGEFRCVRACGAPTIASIRLIPPDKCWTARKVNGPVSLREALMRAFRCLYPQLYARTC